jgi:Uma2 family endonuclease
MYLLPAIYFGIRLKAIIKICQAPDAMVVFCRPKGNSPEATLCERESYQQWEEANIAPQVVFEILSPGNRVKEMSKKLLFYQHY